MNGNYVFSQISQSRSTEIHLKKMNKLKNPLYRVIMHAIGGHTNVTESANTVIH